MMADFARASLASKDGETQPPSSGNPRRRGPPSDQSARDAESPRGGVRAQLLRQRAPRDLLKMVRPIAKQFGPAT
eukprot:5486970-Pyramimonas_sp.AAC.1